MKLETQESTANNQERGTLSKPRVLFFSYFLLVISCISYAQKKNIDSLVNLIPKVKTDTALAELYINISREYAYIDEKNATEYANKALALSQKSNYLKGQGRAIRNLAIIEFYKGNFKKSIEMYKQALPISISAGDSSTTAQLYRAIGISNDRLGNFIVAKSYYDTALTKFQIINDSSGIAGCYSSIGIIYNHYSDYEKCLEYYFKSLKIREGRKKEERNVGDILNNIGAVYISLNNLSKANEFFLKAVAIRKKLQDKRGLAISYNSISNQFIKNSQLDSAEYYGKLALKNAEAVKFGEVITSCYTLFGEISAKQGNYSQAYAHFTKASQISLQSGDIDSYVVTIINMADMALTTKNYNDAEKKYKTIIDTAIIYGLGKELSKCYSGLAEVFYNTSRAADAYLYSIKSAYINDSLAKKNNADAIAKRQALYEVEKHEQEVILLKNKQEISNLEIEKQNANAARQETFIYAAVGGIILLFIVLLLMYSRYRTKQRLNEKLERLSIVASHTDNIVIILDANGKIEWVNDSFTRINGINIEELIKQKGETIYEVSNNPNIKNYIEQAIVSKKSVVYESKNINKKNEITWEQSMLTPVFSARGEIQKLIIVDTNITQRKLDEQIISEKNKDITDSINYAKRIQQAMLPSMEVKEKMFPESFIYFEPRDIVSGDFYWFAEKPGIRIIAAVDCTGHGVPGALMSMIGNAFLNDIVNGKGITRPDLILSELRHLVIKSLKQTSTESASKDGMDIALITINNNTNTLEFAGANNPLWHCTRHDSKWLLSEIAPDKRSIGFFQGKGLPFTNNQIKITKGDTFYIFTDGFADQFGGEKGKKYKYKNFQKTILGIQSLPMWEQGNMIKTEFQNWKGELDQVDDVLVIGIKI